MNAELQNAIQNGQLWQGKHWNDTSPISYQSGHPALDSELPGGGWPEGALIDIFCEEQGMGELRLLVPMLAKASEKEQWISFIAPPNIPYAPAFSANGIDVSKIMVIHAQRIKDQLWTIEESLKSGVCSVILAWPGSITNAQARRLQLAAEESSTLLILFRPLEDQQKSSPAPLRIKLDSLDKGSEVTLLKRKGGWSSQPIQLDLDFDSILPPTCSKASNVHQGPWNS